MAVTTLRQPGDSDPNKILIQILPGAGGQDANRFALELALMYESYAHSNGWTVEREKQSADLPTTARSTICVRVLGAQAGRRLSFETGVHRVQRVPADERHGRVHTSPASVIVVPDELPDGELTGQSDRSEKVRTYNFPDDRVTDHRLRFSLNGVRQVLAGGLDPILDALFGE